jgi:transporter family protein
MIVKSYVLWALVACVTYSFVPPLVRVATREIPGVPAAFISNLVLVLAILVVILVSGYEVVPHMRSGASLYLYAAGLFLGVGILAYYRALELGPVSVVVPIFAMFIVGGSLIGYAVLDETMTLTNGAGILLGVAAVYLISL